MADTPQHSDIIFYNTPTGDVKIEVIFNDETFWVTRLDAFLQFNEYNILKGAGKVSHDVAMKLAEKEYSKFTSKNPLHFPG
ncbi:MAG: virulence RhuM family protein [Sediminibacterium magnilacihabitans]|jgi:hypothetical protein|nr:virulence RhuM family protein [Sediminibacterium magnilacihabitans]PQV59558.1 virulence RhuM family protein [Sediminibacterium magnilacihabitans]